MAHSFLNLRQPVADGPAPTRRAPVPRRAMTRPQRRAVRPHHVALALLLGLAALGFLWDLTASGDANSFYAAAVQAGTKSWKAFFFGSLDTSSFITVDKPPASLWVMELSGRLFGFSSASMLVPQALEGVAAVALLAASVRRWCGPWPGIAAGALLAATPIAAVMFRFDNPDALLVLLLVAGAYCLVRALERGATRWILAAGALIGLAFLAKMLQAFVVLPGFAAVYLLAAPGPLRRRTWQVLAAGGAVVVSCGWWLLAVSLWPVADRPMIDGSPTNNIFNLIFGYNGLGRVFGGGGGPGGGGGASFSGTPGVLRLFNDLMGSQASWLIPAALIALAAGVIARGRAPRTDRIRAALLLWGSWLVVTGMVFSFSSGTIHTYYTVALAPAIAGLVAIGTWQAWQARSDRRAQAVVALAAALTAAWACVLLGRTPSWNGWLISVIIACGALGLIALAAAVGLSARGSVTARRVGVAAALLATVACLAGPIAFTASAVTTPQSGSTPSAGPATGRAGVGAGGRHRFASFGGGGSASRGSAPPGGFGGAPGSSGSSGSSGSGPAGGTSGSAAGPPAGATSGHGGTRTGGTGTVRGGGFGGSDSVSAALRRTLESDASRYRWVAAVSGSQAAASYELATGGDPVMAIGGFSGEGGHITLAQFTRDVARGEIHLYIASGGGGAGGPGGGSSTSAITTWVQSHFTRSTVGGTTVYVLTSR